MFDWFCHQLLKIYQKSFWMQSLGEYIKPLCFSVFLFFSGTHSLVWTDMVYVAVINHCNCTIGNFSPPCWMAADILIAQGEIYWSTLCYIFWLKLKTAETGVKFGFSQELQIPLGLCEMPLLVLKKKMVKLLWLFLPAGCKPNFPNYTEAFFCTLSFEYWSWVGLVTHELSLIRTFSSASGLS